MTLSKGLMSYVPEVMLPYAELARIDKPGFIVLWLVHAIGVLHAGILTQARPSEVLHLLGFFVIACEVLMWVNFAWNDSCDSHLDAKVVRTRHRPLVRGAVSLPAALIFDGLLAVVMIIFLIPLPRVCTMYAIPMAAGCFIYPLSKRWTNYPQLILALILPSGVIMGAAAMGVAPLPYPSDMASIFDARTWKMSHPIHAAAIFSSYLTNVVWTIVFEMIYSFQDAKWDEAAGIGTMTRLLKSHRAAKVFLLILATAQTALHARVGSETPMQSTYWPLSVVATMITLVVQISCVDLSCEESCMFWFGAGNMLTGFAMLGGYVCEYGSQAVG